MKTIEDEFREMLELPETAPAELDVAFSWQDESDTQSLDDEADLPGYDSDWSPSVYPSVQYDRHRERPILDQLVASTTGRVPEAIYDLLTEGSAHAQRHFGYDSTRTPHPPKCIRKQFETLGLSLSNSKNQYE